MRAMLNRWREDKSIDQCRVLLCGVTPEIVGMDWPDGTLLWACERSRPMIAEFWGRQDRNGFAAVQADWTSLPFEDGFFDIVIGDGCFTSFNYPEGQQRFLDSLRRVLRSGGGLIMRFFTQLEQPECVESVLADMREGRVDNFHEFKWRLAMALQASTSAGVSVNQVWQTWADAHIPTALPRESVGTIEAYRGSPHRLTFATLAEVRRLLADGLVEKEIHVPGYALGARCPILLFTADA
jgi:SAM-dependent methyltransferase